SDLQILISVLVSRKVPYPDCLGGLQSPKSDQIRCIYDAYTGYLEENHLVDKDTVLQWAIRWLDEHPGFRLETIFLYGLFEPMPLERAFIEALQRHATACSYSLPAGDDPRVFQDDGSWLNPDSTVRVDPGSAVEKGISRIFLSNPPFDASSRIALTTYRDRIAEVRGIAEEIRALVDAGVPPGEIAVAFPDLSRGVSLASSIFADFGIPVDAASGELLGESPIVQAVFQVLAVPVHDYPREHVVSLLTSPYLCYTGDHRGQSACLSASDVDRVSRNARILRGRESWMLRLESHVCEVLEASDPGDRSALESLERLRDGIFHLLEDLKTLEGKKSVTAHISALRSLLQRLHYPSALASGDEGIRAQEYSDLSEFASVLDTLERFYGTHPPLQLSLADFFTLLSTLISDTRSTPARNPHAVQVLGIRELVHTSFACTFIADLVEGELPRLTTRLPFTNEQEIRQMATRTREDILREERFYFIAALLSGKRGVYLSSAESDGDTVLLSSRFLVDLASAATVREWEHKPHRHSLLAADTRLGGDLRQGTYAEPHRDLADVVLRTNIENFHRRGAYDSSFDGVLTADAPLRAEIEQHFDQRRVYSPTLLETYAACPFLFYLQRFLHLDPPEDIEPELSARERGSLL
ncbi:MAG TPA: PD-(D/E)XK nuclease family protein, partial [Methanomicrobiales archaeon]|nr:PD-(D/E)XK nuclease family protein [Methanomicrobiales archaeon]